MHDIEMTRNNFSASSTMDKSPALSFAVNNAVQAPSRFSQHGAAAFHNKSEAAIIQEQAAVVCCTHCKQQFLDHKLLLRHQQVCNITATPCKAAVLSNSNSGSASGATTGNSVGKVVARSNPAPVQSCLNTYSGHFTRRQQLMLEDFARRKARIRDLNRRKLLREWEASHPISAHWAPKRKRAATPEPPPSKCMPQEDFLKHLGLVTSSSADRLKHEAEHHGDVDLDCQIVAVEGPIAGEPFHSPRTTRSLMSQLSRESAEAARKRLSFCLENEDASESEVFDSTAAARRTSLGSLLAIDFASPLGQRLKKHMKSDLVVPPIIDIELHCSERIMDAMAAKLRYRVPDYPIMHRKRKGIVTGYCHTFKFNGMERREFIKTLRTGLNAKSRKLLLMTKKCLIKLAKLRPEEIRLWTLRRRTIVNQEIAIDDDLSIVQVDVPEHMFHAVQKMPVPSNNVLFRQSVLEASNRHSSVGGHPYQHHGYSNLASGMPYPYPTSCIRASPPGPMPQFLVKQVNKNWTENGKESQKLVFVPLEEAGPPGVPGARSLLHCSAQRPSKPSSSGIQKSLPRHLRPCPKSKRKQRMPEKAEDSDDSVKVETASSSSDDDNKVFTPERLSQKEGVYPLTLSRAGSNIVHAPWMVPGNPVPQMLHKAANSTSAASSVPVCSGLLHAHGRSVPTALVPQNSTCGESGQMLLCDGASQQVVSASSARTVSETENPIELRKKLSMFNLTRTASSSNSQVVKMEENNRPQGAGNRSPDSFPHLSIGAVYSATDLSNEQLAASLGLECTHSPSSRQPVTLPQPNFLQPEMRSPLGTSSSNPRPVQQPASQSGHPDTAQDKGQLKYCLPQHPTVPKIPLKESPAHQQLTNSGCHHPSIMRGTDTAGAGKASPAPLKSLPAQVRSSKDWTVVRASDDDVVEVICIDDDD